MNHPFRCAVKSFYCEGFSVLIDPFVRFYIHARIHIGLHNVKFQAKKCPVNGELKPRIINPMLSKASQMITCSCLFWNIFKKALQVETLWVISSRYDYSRHLSLRQTGRNWVARVNPPLQTKGWLEQVFCLVSVEVTWRKYLKTDYKTVGTNIHPYVYSHPFSL